MPAIKLTDSQQALRSEVEKKLEEVRKIFKRENYISDKEKIDSLIADLGGKAHELHISLKDTGNKPKHHKYMIENRRVPVDNPKFYEHIHPVEDLLKFIDDTTANDDPIDQTIGEEFNFSVYSRRWGHPDNYKIKRTKDGWEVAFLNGGKCDKSGRPYLFKNLEHDGIEYPSSLGQRMKWLWERAKEDGLSKEQVQQEFNELAEWISQIERNQPQQGVWAGF